MAPSFVNQGKVSESFVLVLQIVADLGPPLGQLRLSSKVAHPRRKKMPTAKLILNHQKVLLHRFIVLLSATLPPPPSRPSSPSSDPSTVSPPISRHPVYLPSNSRRTLRNRLEILWLSTLQLRQVLFDSNSLPFLESLSGSRPTPPSPRLPLRSAQSRLLPRRVPVDALSPLLLGPNREVAGVENRASQLRARDDETPRLVKVRALGSQGFKSRLSSFRWLLFGCFFWSSARTKIGSFWLFFSFWPPLL